MPYSHVLYYLFLRLGFLLAFFLSLLKSKYFSIQKLDDDVYSLLFTIVNKN